MGNIISVSSLNVILSVAYLMDLSSEQKKEMHASLVESRIPRPPFPLGLMLLAMSVLERLCLLGDS